MKKRFIIMLFAVVFFASGFMISASADYYITDTEIGAQSMSKTFEVKKVLGAFEGKTQLNNPQDLYIGKDNKLYIADTGNNRIVVIDKDNRVLNIFDGKYGKDAKQFNHPQGIFVDEIGHIFVADTDNGRIVHLRPDGSFVEEFTQPTEDTFDKSYAFKPMKIAIDNMGIIYIANSFDYHGILTMDANNHFLGYVGATKIGFDLNEWFTRVFATNEQKEVLAKKMPAYFSNFMIKDGLIYATSFWDKTCQIKKLSPAGKNIYPERFYGDENDDDMFNKLPGFVDVAVDKNNIIYAADLVVGKIYIYDMEGKNLAVYGGIGRREGKFEAISSINVDSDGNVYVLDKICGTIQVLQPTVLMENIIKATHLNYVGLYNEAIIPWNNVLKYDSTNNLAIRGLAKAAYGKGEYKKAMDLYYKCFDKAGYSEAFVKYRLDIYRRYFIPVVIIVIGLIALFGYIMKKAKKSADSESEKRFCPEDKFKWRHIGKTLLLMVIHPIDCTYGIKSARKKIKMWHILVFLLAIIIVRIAYIYVVHYPLATLSIISVDIFQQTALLLLPLISFIIVSFGITSISDGKQTFKETAYASLASFVPYILFTLPVALLSHIMSTSENGLYILLTDGIMLWSILLMLMTVKIMNEYSFKKLVFTVLKTVFGIICLWMIIFLFYIILHQTVDFFRKLFVEMNIVINR